MHNAIAHHLLTDAQQVPEQGLLPPGQLPSVYILSMTPHGMEYPFGQFGSAVLADPSQLLVHLQPSQSVEHEKLKSP